MTSFLTIVLGTLATLSVSVGSPPADDLTVLAPPVQDSTYGCLACHADKRRSFRQGIHSDRGIRCADCHGGDPRALTTAAAHRAGFIGAPDKLGTIELCAECHSDPNAMRRFGIAADQLTEFRTSRHGQLLLGARNLDAPTCTNCHDAHTILPPEDARSSVHPLNIPGTCGACHSDEQLMSKYGLPTDQLEQYRIGAHGLGLFERRNFAAPTCVGCHGSHAALPPTVAQITDVCAHCHVSLGRVFADGPHGAPASDGRMRGCLGCHSNHGTARTAETEIVALCRSCHVEGSEAEAIGAELQAEVLAVGEELNHAADAIDELMEGGYNTSDVRFRYRSALTDYKQIAMVQHSLDLEELRDLSLKVRSNTEIILATAEAHAEERWEHKLFMIPIWFLALSAMTLAWFKLRDVSG